VVPTAASGSTMPKEPERLVLFDGECGFCNHAVRWILDADAAGRFTFAPLEGATVARLRERQVPIPQGLDAIVYIERTADREEVHTAATALFRICAQLDQPKFRWLARLEVLPHWLTNLGYRLFARNRRRLSRSLSACPAPSPSQRQRFLP
jgi:predicted DCC family thiol-disulfide oxidoreductase YuxK